MSQWCITRSMDVTRERCQSSSLHSQYYCCIHNLSQFALKQCHSTNANKVTSSAVMVISNFTVHCLICELNNILQAAKPKPWQGREISGSITMILYKCSYVIVAEVISSSDSTQSVHCTALTGRDQFIVPKKQFQCHKWWCTNVWSRIKIILADLSDKHAELIQTNIFRSQ